MGTEVLGQHCIDAGACHHKEFCLREQKCFRRCGGSPLSGYAGPWAYGDAPREVGFPRYDRSEIMSLAEQHPACLADHVLHLYRLLDVRDCVAATKEAC